MSIYRAFQPHFKRYEFGKMTIKTKMINAQTGQHTFNEKGEFIEWVKRPLEVFELLDWRDKEEDEKSFVIATKLFDLIKIHDAIRQYAANSFDNRHPVRVNDIYIITLNKNDTPFSLYFIKSDDGTGFSINTADDARIYSFWLAKMINKLDIQADEIIEIKK